MSDDLSPFVRWTQYRNCECPRDGCETSFFSALGLEFHLINDHAEPQVIRE